MQIQVFTSYLSRLIDPSVRLLQRRRVGITRGLADFQLHLQAANFLIDQVDVHRLLARLAA